MLLELAAGNVYTWGFSLGKIAFQPGRLDAAAPLSRAALQTDDSWLQALLDLTLQLLLVNPQH